MRQIFNAEVVETPVHLIIKQTRYIEDITKEFDIDTSVPVYTPAGLDLLDVVTKAPAGTALDAKEHSIYRSIVGAVLYVAMVTRPDVALSTSLLSRALEHPTAECLEAAKRVVSYLYHTRQYGIRYFKGEQSALYGLVDSDWAAVKSTTGYVFFFSMAAIAYIAQKQKSTAMSSTEAEIMAASVAALEAVFLRGLLHDDFGIGQDDPTKIGIDNQGAVALAKNYISNSKTKHIARRHLKIRELVEELQVCPEYVPTDANIADIFTKPLGRRRFEKLRKVLLNHD